MNQEQRVRDILEDIYIEGTRHTMGFKRNRKTTIAIALSEIMAIVGENGIVYPEKKREILSYTEEPEISIHIQGYNKAIDDMRELNKGKKEALTAEEIAEIIKKIIVNRPIAGDLDRTRAIYVNDKVCENIAKAIIKAQEEEMKVYCENCKWLDSVPAELGLGVHCRLYIPKESPLSKNDIGRSLDIAEDNKNNDCKYYKPHFIKRIKDFFSNPQKEPL